MNTSCPNDALLNRFLEGKLSDAETQEIDAHVSSCERCLAVLERINGSPAGLMGLAIEILETKEASPKAIEPLVAGYHILDYVASGSMGMVYRVRHEQLARTLAIKVLRTELSRIGECRERFLRETYVNAGLQHPCIVPVHELGTTSDGRPFFSMKLVGGQTLKSRLESRNDPSVDLSEFLRIFGLVCSGVAYAHSQRVIHRDIKPANIMVGDFGEVQVMDWGLAKSLDSAHIRFEFDWRSYGGVSDSSSYQTQDALGTYAYMPPEQAVAQVELQDERSDVFSLGAVLCHILTGAPPYDHSHELTIRQQAEQSLLEPALRRLETCGADQSLIQLTRSCLAVNCDDRPRSASLVAQAIANYQSEVQDRLRRVEAEKVAALVQATEERKRRRLTTALAVSVVTVLGLVGTGVWWQQQLRARQQGQRAEQLLRSQNVVDQAMTSLEQGNLPASRAAFAQLDHRLLQDLSPKLSAQADQAKSELELASRLEELDDLRWQVLEGTVSDKDYFRKVTDAFQNAGIELLAADLDQIVTRIRGAKINVAVLDFLDRWTQSMTDGQISRRLFQLASLSDLNPSKWKERARELDVRSNSMELERLIDETPWTEATSSLVVSIAIQIRSQGGEVVSFLQRAQTVHPDDFWINSLLGQAMIGGPNDLKKGPRDLAIAVGYLRAALATRPQSAAAQSNLGVALTALGEFQEAIALLKEAVVRLPDHYRVHLNLGVAYDERREFPLAIASFHKALELNKNQATALYRLGLSLLKSNQVDEAVTAFQASIDAEAQHPDVWSRLGDAHLIKQEWAKAIEKYRRALLLDPKLARTHGNLSVALRHTNQFDEAIKAAEKAVELRGDRTAYQILEGAYLAKGLLDKAQVAGQKSQSAKP